MPCRHHREIAVEVYYEQQNLVCFKPETYILQFRSVAFIFFYTWLSSRLHLCSLTAGLFRTPLWVSSSLISWLWSIITSLCLWPRINVSQPPRFASPFSALLPFICSVGPWTSPSTGCRTFCVRLSCGSRQQWRTEHPYTQSNTAKDIEKQWLYSKNKLSGSNLTSAVWTVLPLEERCRLLPRLKQCPQMSEVKCLCCVIIPQLKPP